MTAIQTDGQSRIEIFTQATANATPNSEASRAAQRLFKQDYMGLTPDNHGHLLGIFPSVSADERPFLQTAFLNGLKALAQETGVPAEKTDVETLIGALPEKMRHTVHKVGLECGLSKPR